MHFLPYSSIMLVQQNPRCQGICSTNFIHIRHSLTKFDKGGIPLAKQNKADAAKTPASRSFPWLQHDAYLGDAVTARAVHPHLDEESHDDVMSVVLAINTEANKRVEGFRNMMMSSDVFAEAMKSKETRLTFVNYYARHYILVKRLYNVPDDDELPKGLKDLSLDITLADITGKRSPYAMLKGHTLSDMYARKITDAVKDMRGEELWEVVHYLAKKPYECLTTTLQDGRFLCVPMPILPPSNADEDTIKKFLCLFQVPKQRSSKSRSAAAITTGYNLQVVNPAITLEYLMDAVSPMALDESVKQGEFSANGAVVQCQKGSNAPIFDFSHFYDDDAVNEWERKAQKNIDIKNIHPKASEPIVFLSEFQTYLARSETAYEEAWILDAMRQLSESASTALEGNDAAIASASAEKVSELSEKVAELEKALADSQKTVQEKDKRINELEQEAVENRHAAQQVEHLKKELEDVKDAFKTVHESIRPKEEEPVVEEEPAEIEAEVEDVPLDASILDRISAPVIVGGHDNFVAEMKKFHPNLRIYQYNITDDALQNATIIWIKHTNISHSFFHRAVRYAKTHNIPVYFLETNSVKICKEQLIRESAEYLKAME